MSTGAALLASVVLLAPLVAFMTYLIVRLTVETRRSNARMRRMKELQEAACSPANSLEDRQRAMHELFAMRPR